MKYPFSIQNNRKEVKIMTGKKNNNKSTLSDVGEALDSSALEKEKGKEKKFRSFHLLFLKYKK